MDKKRSGRPRTVKEASPPLASRTRSKSPARVEVSGRDSAPIINKRVGRSKKTDTPSEEISSSSQSSTPKKLKPTKKEKPAAIILDDSGDNEEVATINSRKASLRKRVPANYKTTPTPSEEKNRSVSRTASSLTKEDSDEDDDDEEVKVVPTHYMDFHNLGFHTKPIASALLLIVLGVLPIALVVCSQANWKWPSIVAHLKNFENFGNKQSLSFILAIHSGVALLSLLPVGRFIRLADSDKEYKFNGILSAFIITGFLFALELKNLDALTAIHNNFDRLLCLSILRSIVGSVETYLLAKYRPSSEVNPTGKSGKFIVDFVAGAEINPKLLGRFDIKTIHYNESIILLLVLNITLLFKNLSLPIIENATEASPINELIKQTYANFVFIVQNSEYNAAAFVVSGLLVLYALDLLIYEHHLAASFQINDEGCGAEMFLRFASFPFLVSLLPRYLLVNDVQINKFVLAFAAIIFIVGLIIKRGSNCLKYEYRVHPTDPKFKDLATLPTFQNRRLIISKWFSKIRQPNLFGEILLHLALLNLLASNFNCAAFSGIFIIIVYLIYRSIGINRKNAIKYESSWQRYLSAVRFNLLPRVY